MTERERNTRYARWKATVCCLRSIGFCWLDRDFRSRTNSLDLTFRTGKFPEIWRNPNLRSHLLKVRSHQSMLGNFARNFEARLYLERILEQAVRNGFLRKHPGKWRKIQDRNSKKNSNLKKKRHSQLKTGNWGQSTANRNLAESSEFESSSSKFCNRQLASQTGGELGLDTVKAGWADQA